jgi:MFS family permease
MENSSLSPLHAHGEPYSEPTLKTYLGISVFNLALAFFWGAMMVLVLPHRVAEIAGEAQKDHVLALVSSCGALMSGVTQIVFGAFSDNTTHKLGPRRPYLIGGVWGTTLVLLFLPQAHTVGALLAVMVGVQLFLNIANGPYQALMPDLIPPDHHGRASAYLGVCRLLGQVGGPAVAGILLQKPNGLFWLTIVFIVLLNGLLAINVFFIKEKPLAHGEGVGTTLKSLLRVPLRPYPNFVWLLVSRFGIMLGVYTILPFLEYYVRDTLKVPKANALSVVTTFVLIATVTGLIGTIIAGIAADKFSKKRIIFVANGICMLAASGFIFARTPEQAYYAIAIYGTGFGTFMAVDWALACGLLPPGAPAKYLGFWSLSDVLPQVVAPIVAGPLAGHFNSIEIGSGYRVLMGIAILYFALGTFAISFIKEPKFAINKSPH